MRSSCLRPPMQPSWPGRLGAGRIHEAKAVQVALPATLIFVGLSQIQEEEGWEWIGRETGRSRDSLHSAGACQPGHSLACSCKNCLCGWPPLGLPKSVSPVQGLGDEESLYRRTRHAQAVGCAWRKACVSIFLTSPCLEECHS